ncbi:hypothetical protein CBL_12404 [Carabus blaptoides fortunei]
MAPKSILLTHATCLFSLCKPVTGVPSFTLEHAGDFRMNVNKKHSFAVFAYHLLSYWTSYGQMSGKAHETTMRDTEMSGTNSEELTKQTTLVRQSVILNLYGDDDTERVRLDSTEDRNSSHVATTGRQMQNKQRRGNEAVFHFVKRGMTPTPYQLCNLTLRVSLNTITTPRQPFNAPTVPTLMLHTAEAYELTILEEK